MSNGSETTSWTLHRSWRFSSNFFFFIVCFWYNGLYRSTRCDFSRSHTGLSDWSFVRPFDVRIPRSLRLGLNVYWPATDNTSRGPPCTPGPVKDQSCSSQNLLEQTANLTTEKVMKQSALTLPSAKNVVQNGKEDDNGEENGKHNSDDRSDTEAW